jgi:isoleucyl-tRNA synthetase
VDLSNFYLDIGKDRLYISAPDAPRRRSCQTVLQIALESLARAIAPVLCHLAEDIWQYLPYTTPHQSVFQAGWIQLEDQWQQPDLATQWQYLRQLRTEVNKVLERARAEKAIGSSLEAKILLWVPEAQQQLLEALNPANTLGGNGVDDLRYLFLVSQVELLTTLAPLEGLKYQHYLEPEQIGIGMTDADGQKCDRCWNYSTQVGRSPADPLLCERCVEALAGNF